MNHCYYCGVPFGNKEPGKHKTIDHRVPLSRGGTNTVWNRVHACYHCNHTKGNMTDGEFMAWLKLGRPRKKDYLREIGL